MPIMKITTSTVPYEPVVRYFNIPDEMSEEKAMSAIYDVILAWINANPYIAKRHLACTGRSPVKGQLWSIISDEIEYFLRKIGPDLASIGILEIDVPELEFDRDFIFDRLTGTFSLNDRSTEE